MKLKFLVIAVFFIFFTCKDDDNGEPTPQETVFLGELNRAISLGGSLNESFLSITKTNDGGFAAVGGAQSNDSDVLAASKGESDYLIVKYDTNFNLTWSKLYGGTSTEIAKSIAQTNDDGYIVSGYTKSNDLDVVGNHGQRDLWILKLDSSGNIQWKKTFGFVGDDESFSIIQTKDGGYFTCGYLDVTASGGQGNDNGFRSSSHGIGDYWGIKLNADGEFIWRRFFGGFNNDKAFSIIETSNGDFIMAGAAESIDVDISNPKGGYDIWVVRISNTGNLIWEKSFGGSETEDCFKIINSNDGNFFVLGNTRSNDQDVSNNHGFADIWLLKITPNGDLIWEKTYGGSQFDSASSIIPLQDGNFMISGNTRSDDIYEIKGQNDILIIKIDPNGEIIRQDTFGGSKIDVSHDLIETNENAIIIVGDSQSNDFDITNNFGFTDAVILEIK